MHCVLCEASLFESQPEMPRYWLFGDGDKNRTSDRFHTILSELYLLLILVKMIVNKIKGAV